MPTIAFWNLHRSGDFDLLTSLIEENGVEILIVSEMAFEPNDFVREFANSTGRPFFHVPPVVGISRVSVFSGFPVDQFAYRSEDYYSAVLEFTPEVGLSVLIVAAHLPSKLRLDRVEQLLEGVRLRSQVDTFETAAGHNRTLIIGDLNMNPFDDGVVASDALHGVMDRRVALNEKRTVLYREHPFFYNPMWRQMGDSRADVMGTYYSSSGKHIHYFWDTLDQVLLRPALLPHFDDMTLRIVTRIGTRSLLAREAIGLDNDVSDHLPVVLRIET